MPADRTNPLWLAEPLLGPVCVHELTRAGRRFVNLLARVGYLAVVAWLLFLFVWDSWYDSAGRSDPRELAAFAERFFQAFVAVQFCAVVGLTPLYTAGAITDEKERKTLHFLLCTGLTGREIVLGKVAARTANVLLFVLAGLPILAFLQLLGGIEPVLLAGATAGTALTVLGVAATGAAVSVFLNKTRDAILVTYGIGFAYLLGSGMVYEEASSLMVSGKDWLSAATGGRLTYMHVAEVVGAGNPLLFTRKAAWNVTGTDVMAGASLAYAAFYAIVTAAGLAVAAGFVRRAAHDPAPASRKWWWVNKLLGRRATARPHPPVSDEPVRWRESYTGSASLWKRAVAVLVAGAIVFSFLAIVWDHLVTASVFYYPRGFSSAWDDFAQSVRVWVCAVTVGLGMLVLFGTTVHAAAAVTGEREGDTWVSLLTAPLTADEIVRGKWWGAMMTHRRPIYLLAGVWAIGVLTGGVNVFAVLLLAGVFVLYLRAYAWIGLLASVTATRTIGAVMIAVPAAFLATGAWWLLLGCCCVLVRGGGLGPDAVLELIGITLVELTPPVMLGCLVFTDEFWKGFLRNDTPTREHAFIAVGFAVQIGVWLVLAQVLGELCRDRMREITNRTPLYHTDEWRAAPRLTPPAEGPPSSA